MANYLKALVGWLKIISKSGNNLNLGRKKAEDFQLPESIDFCHKDKVHIFVRGLADGKLHAAKNRNYSDFRFYKKDGLRVFCAVCRKRLL